MNIYRKAKKIFDRGCAEEALALLDERILLQEEEDARQKLTEIERARVLKTAIEKLIS